MKHLLLCIISMLIYLSTFGQSTHVGKIINMSVPCDTIPCTTGLVFGIEIVSGDSVPLTRNLHFICSDEELNVNGITYSINDLVLLRGGVYINGCNTILFIFDIEMIERLLTANQDIQGFLGTYSITAICKPANGAPDLYPQTRTVVIEEGIDSDLLIHFSSSDTLIAFVLDDSSFVIPRQILEFDFFSERFFWGDGVIKNDSICFSYTYGEVASVPPYNDMGTFHCNNCNEGSTNTASLSTNQNKIYYDAINQIIVIDADLLNQSLTLELYDMQGSVILRKTNVDNSINIASLPNGVYLYKLLGNSQMIYSGKILK